MLHHRGQVRLGGKARVARDLPRLATEMGRNVVNKRHEGTVVGGGGHQAMRHDHLMRCIDRDPTVVALHEPIARGQEALSGSVK